MVSTMSLKLFSHKNTKKKKKKNLVALSFNCCITLLLLIIMCTTSFGLSSLKRNVYTGWPVKQRETFQSTRVQKRTLDKSLYPRYWKYTVMFIWSPCMYNGLDIFHLRRFYVNDLVRANQGGGGIVTASSFCFFRCFFLIFFNLFFNGYRLILQRFIKPDPLTPAIKDVDT